MKIVLFLIMLLISISFVYAGQDTFIPTDGTPWGIWATGVFKACVRFTPNRDLTNISVHVVAGNNASDVVLRANVGKAVLANITGISPGDNVTFNYAMGNGTFYDICSESGTADNLYMKDNYLAYPDSTTLVNFTSDDYHDGSWNVYGSRFFSFDSLTFTFFGSELDFISPASSNQRNDTQITFNITCSEPTDILNLYFNFTDVYANISNNTNSLVWVTNVTSINDTYNYFASCNGLFNSTLRTWALDSVFPVIVLNPNNYFNITNGTLDQKNTNLIFNMTFVDDELSEFIINVSDGSNLKFSYTNTTLSGSNADYQASIDMSNWDTRTYFVNLLVTDGLNLREEHYQFDLNFFDLDNCSTYNVSSLNVSFYNPSSGLTNVNYEVFLNFWKENPLDPLNYSFEGSATNFSICIFPPNINLTSNFLIQYNNNSYNGYEVELNNITSLLSLYTQTDTSEVTFTVLDFSGDAVQNAFIHVQQWDVGTNTYTSTEILKTDVNGVAVGNIILSTQFYRFLIEFEGEIKLIDPDTQGIKIYTTTRTFTISTEETEWFDDYETVLGTINSMTFNNNTNTFNFEWLNQDGDTIVPCTLVTKTNTSGGYTLDDSCGSAAISGNKIYMITPTNCSSFIAQGYFFFDGTKYTGATQTESYQCDYSLLGKKGTSGDLELSFFAFILVLALALMGIPYPELSFILMSLGLIVTSVLQLWDVSIGLVISIIVIGVFHMMAGNRK